MAEIGGNFVNPSYASPEQIKFLREYAKQLMTEQPVHHWAQGVGNIARALVGGYEGGKADKEEQIANREFSKQLMEATASKDPAKLMEVMSNPRAAPVQALLARQLLEWGPEKGVTLPSGLAVRGPTEPWFSGAPSVPTQRFAPPAAAPPTAPPNPHVPPTAPAQPNAETSSVGEVVPGSRTVTGSPDSAFDTLGQKYGVPNLGALNTAGMKNAAELKAAETKAQETARQEVKTSVTAPIIADIQKNLKSDIPDAISYLDKHPNQTTGRVAWMSSNVVGTPAHTAAEKLAKIENSVLQHEIQKIEDVEQRRISPQEAEAIRGRLGLGQNQDYQNLRYNLLQLQKRFAGEGSPTRTQPPNLTPQSGQAQAEPGRETPGFKILKVRPGQ